MSERALPPGLRYLIEQHHAADGSHGENDVSTQDLVNPRTHDPTRHDVVAEWVRRRVAADKQMRHAAGGS